MVIFVDKGHSQGPQTRGAIIRQVRLLCKIQEYRVINGLILTEDVKKGQRRLVTVARVPCGRLLGGNEKIKSSQPEVKSSKSDQWLRSCQLEKISTSLTNLFIGSLPAYSQYIDGTHRGCKVTCDRLNVVE